MSLLEYTSWNAINDTIESVHEHNMRCRWQHELQSLSKYMTTPCDPHYPVPAIPIKVIIGTERHPRSIAIMVRDSPCSWGGHAWRYVHAW